MAETTFYEDFAFRTGPIVFDSVHPEQDDEDASTSNDSGDDDQLSHKLPQQHQQQQHHHQQQAHQQAHSKGRAVSERVRRSCLQCRQARRACSNERPCMRCVSKNMGDQCSEGTQLPPGRPKRQRPAEQPFGTASNNNTNASWQGARMAVEPPFDFSQTYRRQPPTPPDSVLWAFQQVPNTPAPSLFDDVYADFSLTTGVTQSLHPDAASLWQASPLSLVPDLDADKATWSHDTSPSYMSSTPLPSPASSFSPSTAYGASPNPTQKFHPAFAGAAAHFTQNDFANSVLLVKFETDAVAAASSAVTVWHADPQWTQSSAPEVTGLMDSTTRVTKSVKTHYSDVSGALPYYNVMATLASCRFDMDVHNFLQTSWAHFGTLCDNGHFKETHIPQYVPPAPVSDDGVLLPTLDWDFFCHVMDFNEAFCSMLGYSHNEMASMATCVTDLAVPEDQNCLSYLIVLALAGPVLFMEIPVRFVRRNGSFVSCRVNITCVRAVPTGKLMHCAAVLTPMQSM